MLLLTDHTDLADLLDPLARALALVRPAAVYHTLTMLNFIALGVLLWQLKGIATLREQVQILLYLHPETTVREPLARSTWSDTLIFPSRQDALVEVVPALVKEAQAVLPDRLAAFPERGDRNLALGWLAYTGQSASLGDILGYPLDEVTQFFHLALEAGTKQHSKAIPGIFQDCHQARLNLGAALGDDEAVFCEEATDLVDLGGALFDGLTTHAVNGLEILLLDALDGDEAHGGPLRRLGDRFGIRRAILVGLDERLDELRADQLHLVATSLEGARTVVSTPWQPGREADWPALAPAWPG